MRHLLACTCLTPVALFLASGEAAAQRTINGATTTPVATATATTNGPGNISITSAGSIKLTGGAAVTVNSSNDVSNAGTIEFNNASNADGILILPGHSGTIANSGTIQLLEDYAPADGDKDGDLDGPFAQGSNRYGIRLAPGGTFTGTIANTNRILIEGNQSAGIALDSALAGSLTNNGTISVTGNDSQGIRAGAISGNVRIAGSITVQGQNSVGVALDGNIGGALVFQGSVSATGYRSATPPADASKLDSDDLLQGGPAVRVAGNVAGGIIFAVAPPDNSTSDDDEDDDGIKDAEEGAANIRVAGAAPAVQIGSSAQDVTVGAVAGNAQGHGLVIQGGITAGGTYAGVDGNGLVIGGLGRATTIAGGMTVSGSVIAESNGGNATALRIGSGASVPEIQVSGTIRGNGGGDAGDLSRAIQIDQGATVAAIRNVGGIIQVTAGKDGTATAINDASGGVATLLNQGTISAGGGTTAAGAGPTAINLSANQTGVTMTQSRLSGSSTPVPKIIGDVRLGSGNDLFVVSAGSVSGRTFFGAGADRLALSGDATYSGAIDFGAGDDDLMLGGTSVLTGSVDFGAGAGRIEIGGTAQFRGSLASGAGVDVVVNGGTFHAAQTTPVALASLSVGNNSTLGVDIGGAPGAATRYDVAGAASFGTGTKIRARIVDLASATGRHVILDAGSLTAGQPIAFDSEALPFLFSGTVEADAAAGEVAVTIARKTAAQLELNRSAASAYDAVFAALTEDDEVAGVFLGLTSGDAVRAQIAQMLPDHAGGTFETVTLGSRTTARFLADPAPASANMGGWRLWLQQAGFGTSKDLGDTAAYDVSGWSAVLGAERDTGFGSIGASIAYLTGSDADGSNDNYVKTEHYELAAHWRGRWGDFGAFVRGSAGTVGFDSTRVFTGTGPNGQPLTRTTNGEWSGEVYSAAAGLFYDLRIDRFTLRPSLAIDYYRLSEDGYTEAGGGEGLDLNVDERTSDELAGTLSLAAGYEFARAESSDGIWLRGEIEGGRRQILGGALGETIARFEGGTPFTLQPEERADGWTGGLRLVGGQGGTIIGGEIRAEEQSGHASVSGRVSIGIAF